MVTNQIGRVRLPENHKGPTSGRRHVSIQLSLALIVLTTISLAFPGKVRAQTSSSSPGSILIFPVYDFGSDRESIITITNTNRNQAPCPNGTRVGDVNVRFRYVRNNCIEYTAFEILAPADTLTVIASRHNPEPGRGYLLVEARDPETRFPIDFDFLIGSARLIDSTNGGQFSYLPYSFQALPTGTQPFGTSNCGHPFVDVFPSSPTFFERNFNGIEYTAFPETIRLDHFVGEGTGGSTPAVFSNRLHLMSTSSAPARLGILGWNNNGVGSSVDLSIGCSTEMSLQDISNDFRQSLLGNGGDTSEFLGIASGWLEMVPDSPDVGILGVFEERITVGPRSFVGARTLQGAGTRTVALPRSL